MTMSMLQCLGDFEDAYQKRIDELTTYRNEGRKVVGSFCLFVPDEIIYAAGAARVILCGGRNATVSLAEEYLPRDICPLVKSSFGSVVSAACNRRDVCPHFNLIDTVAEATCDAKKKMHELLNQHIPTYVIDLPQKPDSAAGIAYYAMQLEQFKDAMEGLTSTLITDDRLRHEFKSANETRSLLHRLYAL